MILVALACLQQGASSSEPAPVHVSIPPRHVLFLQEVGNGQPIDVVDIEGRVVETSKGRTPRLITSLEPGEYTLRIEPGGPVGQTFVRPMVLPLRELRAGVPVPAKNASILSMRLEAGKVYAVRTWSSIQWFDSKGLMLNSGGSGKVLQPTETRTYFAMTNGAPSEDLVYEQLVPHRLALGEARRIPAGPTGRLLFEIPFPGLGIRQLRIPGWRGDVDLDFPPQPPLFPRRVGGITPSLTPTIFVTEAGTALSVIGLAPHARESIQLVDPVRPLKLNQQVSSELLLGSATFFRVDPTGEAMWLNVRATSQEFEPTLASWQQTLSVPLASSGWGSARKSPMLIFLDARVSTYFGVSSQASAGGGHFTVTAVPLPEAKRTYGTTLSLGRGEGRILEVAGAGGSKFRLNLIGLGATVLTGKQRYFYGDGVLTMPADGKMRFSITAYSGGTCQVMAVDGEQSPSATPSAPRPSS